MSGAPGTEPTFTALVMAASRGPDDPVARYAGIERKCLVEAGGVPMLVRVVGALEASGRVGRILVSVDRPDRFAEEPVVRELVDRGAIELTEAAASPSRSVLRGAETIGDNYPILVTTADSALLTDDMVRFFCESAVASGADIAAGLAPASVILRDFPEAQRTFLRFRDDRYSGCNLFAIMRPAGLAAAEFWERAEQHRKRPWRLVGTFGPVSLLLFALGRLSLDDAMERASKAVGATVRAVKMPFATAAIDVDKPADLVLVEAILSGRRPVGSG